MITFYCKDCRERIVVDDSKAGKAHVCPLCGASLQVPAPAVSTPQVTVTVLQSVTAPTPVEAVDQDHFGLSLTALILSVLAFVFGLVLSPLALALSLVAWRRATTNRPPSSGRSMALAALIISSLGISIVAVVLAAFALYLGWCWFIVARVAPSIMAG